MATSFVFGSSTGPSNVTSAGRAQSAEEFGTQDINDPDRLVQCPFDKNHQIRVCRFPYHLIKCKKNHPKLAKELQTCPYNARHLLPKSELAHHVETCEDRVMVTQDDAERKYKWQVPVSTWTNPNMTENWDEETDDSVTPFVWGTTPAKPILETKPTNNLGPAFRPPNSLPWTTYGH